jgi:hypothetical protein
LTSFRFAIALVVSDDLAVRPACANTRESTIGLIRRGTPKLTGIANAVREKDVNREIDQYLRSHPCVDCGESDPVVLDFDHRDGVEKIETISVLRARGRREQLFAEIAKCDVRCSNCHSRRTAMQFGWSKIVAA